MSSTSEMHLYSAYVDIFDPISNIAAISPSSKTKGETQNSAYFRECVCLCFQRMKRNSCGVVANVMDCDILARSNRSCAITFTSELIPLGMVSLWP